MDQHPEPTPIPAGRDIYCNRTLNLRSIHAIGYDMDYTLIHYKAKVWEETAYQHLKAGLVAMGWPVEHLEFDPEAMIRGLIIDTKLGNVVKANRFGYIKRACHGMDLMSVEEQRRTYARTVVSLSDRRWRFMNTLFSLSEACMYAQLVDLFDAGKLPDAENYAGLYSAVRASLDSAHIEGRLKAEIIADPDRFVYLDPETPLALLDQKHAGKKLLLITNSGWNYTQEMMDYAFDPFLKPHGLTWRELFDVIIVAARKPAFFQSPQPVFEVVNDEGFLKPMGRSLREGVIHHGGHAGMVEEYLNLKGSDILYVGDHIFGDVNVSKNILRWRTALVLHDLEDDLAANAHYTESQDKLTEMMRDKKNLEFALSRKKLDLQRLVKAYGPQPQEDRETLETQIHDLRQKITELDAAISPLARSAWELSNERWGLLMRSGNDKSHLARQVERHADIYTSRVSNFLYRTPFSYIRSSHSSLPHDTSDMENPFQTDGPWSGN